MTAAGESDPQGVISRYRRLLAVKRRESVFRTLRAASLSGLVLSLATLGFLLVARPRDVDFWFGLALVLALLCLLAAPVAVSRLAFQRRRRLGLARRLYAAGFRLDEGDNLVSDEAHARTVCAKC